MVLSSAYVHFMFDQYGKTPFAGVTTPKSMVPPLRETAVVDHLGVRTLVPFLLTIIRPPAHSPGFETSSSRPLLMSAREGWSYASVVPPVGPNDNALLLFRRPSLERFGTLVRACVSTEFLRFHFLTTL